MSKLSHSNPDLDNVLGMHTPEPVSDTIDEFEKWRKNFQALNDGRFPSAWEAWSHLSSLHMAQKYEAARTPEPEAVNIDDLIKAFEAVDKATSDIRMAMPMFTGRDGVVRFELTLDMAQPFMRNSADFCQKIEDAKKAIAAMRDTKPVSKHLIDEFLEQPDIAEQWEEFKRDNGQFGAGA